MSSDDDIFFDATSSVDAASSSRYASSSDAYDASENNSAFGDFEDAYSGIEATTTTTVTMNPQFPMNNPILQQQQQNISMVSSTFSYDDPFAVLSTTPIQQPAQQQQESFPSTQITGGLPGYTATNAPTMDQSESSSGFGDFVDVVEEIKKDNNNSNDNTTFHQHTGSYGGNTTTTEYFGTGGMTPLANGNMMQQDPSSVNFMSGNINNNYNNNQLDDPFGSIVSDSSNSIQQSSGQSTSNPMSIQNTNTTNDPYATFPLENIASNAGSIQKSYSDTVDPFEAISSGNETQPPVVALNTFTMTQSADVTMPEQSIIFNTNISVVSNNVGDIYSTPSTESGNNNNPTTDMFVQNDTKSILSNEFSVERNNNNGGAVIEDESFGDFETHVESTTDNIHDPFANVAGGVTSVNNNYIQSATLALNNTNHMDAFGTGTLDPLNDSFTPQIPPSNGSTIHEIPPSTIPSINPSMSGGSSTQYNHLDDPFSVIATDNTNLPPTTIPSINPSMSGGSSTQYNPSEDPFSVVATDNNNLPPTTIPSINPSMSGSSSTQYNHSDDPFSVITTDNNNLQLLSGSNVDSIQFTSNPINTQGTTSSDTFTSSPLDNPVLDSGSIMRTNSITEDPFGVISSVEQQLPVNSLDTFTTNYNAENIIATKISVGNDDDNSDFGDFVEPNQPQESNAVDVSGGDRNKEVDFTKEIPFINNSSSGATDSNNLVNESIEDDFGDFDDAPTVTVTGTNDFQVDNQQPSIDFYPTATNVTDDDFGDFKAPVSQSGQPIDNVINDDKNADFSDDFGDFDAAPVIQETTIGSSLQDATKVLNGITRTAVHDGDDFGDFGDFNATATPQHGQQQLTATEVANDDFGDFDTTAADETNKLGAFEQVTDDYNNIKNSALGVNNTDQNTDFFGSGTVALSNGSLLPHVQPTSSTSLDDPFNEIQPDDNNIKMSFGSSFDSTQKPLSQTSMQDATDDPFHSLPVDNFAFDSGSNAKTNYSSDDPFASITGPESATETFSIIQQVDIATPENDQTSIFQNNEAVVSDNGSEFVDTPKQESIDDDADLFKQNEPMNVLDKEGSDQPTNIVDEDESFGEFEAIVTSDTIPDVSTEISPPVGDMLAPVTLSVQPNQSSTLTENLAEIVEGKPINNETMRVHDEDFSDFGDFVDPSNATNDLKENANHEVTDDDLQKEIAIMSNKKSDDTDENKIKKSIEEGDDFGEFDNARNVPNIDETGESSLSNQQPIESFPSSTVDADNDFDDFTAPVSSSFTEIQQSSSQVEINKNDDLDDDFGDFDGGPTSEESISMAQVQGTTNDNKDNVATVNDDDFGDFGDFDAASPQNEQEQQLNVPSDDFGGFGCAPTIAENNTLDDFGDVAAISSQSQKDDHQSSTADIAMDDFGDFDNAPIVDDSVKLGQREKESSSLAIGLTDSNDGFGSFETPVTDEFLANGTANHSVQNQVKTDNDASFDDDFGDFDTAPVVQESTFTDSQQNTTEPRKDVLENVADDDDFGDFGDFDAAPQEQEQQATGALVDDDFDDDFGDFDTAQTNPESPSPQSTQPQTNNNVGGFPSFPVETPAPKQVFNDPFIQHIQSVVPKLFPDQLQDEIDDEGDETNAQTAVASIKEILTSLEKDYKEPKPDNSYTSLLKVLNSNPTQTESTSNAIVQNGGKGPFGHISYPVGGFKSYSSRAQI